MARVRPPTSIPANPDEWSESSKRSYIFDSPPSEYRDHLYKCWTCGQPSIFSAEAQRETYEVRKAYIWQRRVLCEDCFQMREQIENGLKACAEAWISNRATLNADKQFLRRWLTLLEDHVHYGGRIDVGNTDMLRRLLGSDGA